MTQKRLFFAGIEEAAEEIAKHYEGGPKALAHRMRPLKSVDAAHKWWLDCCNEDRTEHNFTGDDWLALIKIGREIDCHAVLHFICDEASYERPAPIEPQVELASLIKSYIGACAAQANERSKIDELIRKMPPDLAHALAQQLGTRR